MVDTNKLNIWDWRYQIFFHKEICKKVDTFKKSLTSTEQNIYEEIIQYYLSLYSISNLLDAVESHSENANEYILYAKKNIDKILYTPNIIEESICARIESLENRLQKDFLDILNKSKNQTPNFNIMDLYISLFGENFMDKCKLLFHNDYIFETLDHGVNMSLNDIKESFYNFYNKTIKNEMLIENYGVSKVSNFDIKVKKNIGFAEWWDKSLADQAQDLLILYDNSDLKSANDFTYTIIHEVYPGHGHFYNYILKDDIIFDHGAIALIEGWATFAEWHTLPSKYAKQIRNNAICFLKESLIENVDDKAEKIYNRKISQGYSKKEAVRTVLYSTQYIGFIESYYLGALWIEQYCNKNSKTPKEFLEFLSQKNVGELFKLWM